MYRNIYRNALCWELRWKTKHSRGKKKQGSTELNGAKHLDLRLRAPVIHNAQCNVLCLFVRLCFCLFFTQHTVKNHYTQYINHKAQARGIECESWLHTQEHNYTQYLMVKTDRNSRNERRKTKSVVLLLNKLILAFLSLNKKLNITAVVRKTVRFPSEVQWEVRQNKNKTIQNYPSSSQLLYYFLLF